MRGKSRRIKHIMILFLCLHLCWKQSLSGECFDKLMWMFISFWLLDWFYSLLCSQTDNTDVSRDNLHQLCVTTHFQNDQELPLFVSENLAPVISSRFSFYCPAWKKHSAWNSTVISSLICFFLPKRVISWIKNSWNYIFSFSVIEKSSLYIRKY